MGQPGWQGLTSEIARWLSTARVSTSAPRLPAPLRARAGCQLHNRNLVPSDRRRRRRRTLGLRADTLATAVPLVAKGRAQNENVLNDINYFLGIDTEARLQLQTTRWLPTSRDCQRGATRPTRPSSWSTIVPMNTWHHAAITYNGSVWHALPRRDVEEAIPEHDRDRLESSRPSSPSLRHGVRRPGAAADSSPASSTRSESGTPRVRAQIRANGRDQGLSGQGSILRGQWGHERRFRNELLLPTRRGPTTGRWLRLPPGSRPASPVPKTSFP